jgi:eukaryotic-like serine/threonine-protein kinase
MLAGEPPFTAPTTQALIAKVMTDDARPLEIVRKSVPENVAVAVHRALEKVPADRFATTREFVAALTNDTVVSGARRRITVRSRGAERRWIPIGAATLVAGALIGALVDRAARGPATSDRSAAPVVFTVEPDSGQRLSLVCCGDLFSLSSDGRRLAYQAVDADSIVRLHVREMDALMSRSLKGTENPHELFFSPDGQQVGFTSGRTLKTVDLRSGRVRTVTDVPPTGFLGGGTWTTDGRLIYAVGNTLFTVSADGGTATVLVQLDSTKKEYQIGGPRFVAGADLLLFAVERGGREPLVRARWLKSGKTKDVALGVAVAVDTTRGLLIGVRSDGTVEARHFNAATGDTTGPAIRVGDPVALRSPVFLYAEFAASANGTIVSVTRSPFSSSAQGALHLVSAAGRDETHLLPFRARRVGGARFSPDGKLIAALDDDLEKRSSSIFIYDPERRATTPLAYPTSVTAVEWIGPDSLMSIATSGEVFVQSIHGEAPRRLGALGGWNNSASLSVRGNSVVFDGDRSGSPDIGVVRRDSIDHSRVLLGSPVSERRPRLSPDGRNIAFLVARDGPSALHVASFPSLSDEIVIADAVTSEARWGRDGLLYYLDADRRVVAVKLQPGAKLAVASKVPSQALINSAALGWDVDATGKRFVYGSDASNNGGPPRLVVTVNATANATAKR